MSVRLVLDSSVLVAAMRPTEPGHADSAEFLDDLRGGVERGAAVVFAPPELWIEAHVAVQKGAKGGARARGEDAADAAEILAGLSVKLTPITSLEEISEFLALLGRRTHGKAPFTNATDIVYLWVAWKESATLVTLDRGLLKYHRVLCDVIRPSPVRFT
jgi:predicted nucleic acid-binding protein